jgi:nicotinamidase-related amidase
MTPVYIFVDLLEDFFTQPPLSTRRQSLVRAANEVVGIAREASAPVVWVRQEFEDDLVDAFLSMRQTGRRVTIRGTPGCQLLAELDRRPHDHEIVKKRYSAFFGTGLEELLESLGCTHIVICGVNTHACVRATAIDAYQRDLHVLLAREAISSYDEEYHRESMRYLERSIGTALSNAELRATLRLTSPRPALPG